MLRLCLFNSDISHTGFAIGGERVDLSTSDFPSTLEMPKEKIESNLIEFFKSEGHHPDRNEILIKAELTFELN